MIVFAVSDSAWNTLIGAVATLILALAAAVPGVIGYLNSRRNATNLVKSDAGLEARVSLHDEKLNIDTKPAAAEASALAVPDGTAAPATPSAAAVLKKDIDAIPEKTAAMVRADAEKAAEQTRHTPAT
jgi:hypothetical protein